MTPNVTRRTFITGSIAAGVLMRSQTGLGKAARPQTEVNFAVPAGACDCHTHIFGDPAKYPYFAGRTYTPERALPEELAALHKRLQIERVVIVTPSVYGADNAATLYGMQARGQTARGVAVIVDKTSERELDEMARAGVCGIRLNLATAGVDDPAIARERLAAAIERMQKRGWHVQVFANVPLIVALQETVSRAPVPVVFDHFGGALAGRGTNQPGFAELVALVRSGRAYVKISGAYRASQRPPDYADAAPLARALIAANPDRILWGTDWPHPSGATPSGRKPTDVTPNLAIDDGRLLNELAVWAPDPQVRQKILVDNPARLYGL